MGSMRRSQWKVSALAAAAAVGIALHGGEASAQERFNPRNGLVTTGPFYRFTAAARMNPIGLFIDFRGGYRMRLFNSPTRSVLLRNTYAAVLGSVVPRAERVRREGWGAARSPIFNLRYALARRPGFRAFFCF